MLNAISSSSAPIAAMRSLVRPARNPLLAIPALRAASAASHRSFTSSPSPSARFVHPTSALASPPHPIITRLVRDINPLLVGSPSGYLLRRAFTTSLIARYSATAPLTTPKPSQSESENPSEDDAEPDPNLSAYERLKLLFKRYGWYALGMYTVLSAVDFTLCFVLIHLAGAERIEPLLAVAGGWYRRVRYGEEQAEEMAREIAIEAEDERKRIEAEEKEGRIGKKKKNSGWMSRTVLAEMALAYPIHKVALLPVRAGLTVAWTPKFVGWLTRRGWVGKGGYTRAASHAQDKLRTAKDRVKERVQDLKQ